ncbi:MAG: PAS domain S-box protein [Planctomycetes bacterium]|nr:PAS domain S-box protein [Planctomycetota bacterium]
MEIFRALNKLIASRPDKATFLTEACDLMNTNHGYYNTWVVLVDDNLRVKETYHSGSGSWFSPLEGHIVEDGLVNCCRSTIKSGELFTMTNPEEQCTTCPLAGYYSDMTGLSMRLEYNGKILGALCAAIPQKVLTPLEQMIFTEIAQCLSFVIHSHQQTQERNSILEALKNSEEQLRTTLSSIGDGVIATDLEGRVANLNPVAQHLTGWSMEEALGLPLTMIFNIVNADTRQTVENPIFRVLKTGKIVGLANHTILISKTGEEKQIADSAAPIMTDSGKIAGVVLVFRDVTEEYAMQDAIRKSEGEYHSLFTNMVSGYALHELIVDEAGKPKDYRFLRVNPAFEKMTGLKAEEIIGKTVRQILPNTEKEWIERYGAVTLSGEPIQFDLLSAEIGKYFRVSAFRTEPGKFAVIFNDITGMIDAQNEAREKSNRLESIFAAAPVGIGVVTNRVIQEVNSLVCKMTGYSKEELIGQSSRIFYPTDEDYEYVGKEKYAQIKEFGTGTVETKWRKKDGEIIDLILSSTPIDPDDWEKGVTFSAMDISERKKMEAQLLQSEKMQVIGQLAGGIAHDFNNQLAGIMGYSEMIVNHSTDSRIEKYANNILLASKRAGDLTEKLLAFSRKGNLVLLPTNMHDIIDEVIGILSRSIDKRIQIESRLDATDPITLADSTQIQNAILNLAINARDAMTDGGKLMFWTENVYLDEKFAKAKSYQVLSGEYLKICVSDTGSGISKNNLPHIFEPFFTTKPSGKGTGMGLAAVYGTVKSHNGFINVYSEEQHGTTFNIYLPHKKGGENRASLVPEITKATAEYHLLLIDDEEMIRELGCEMLDELGYKVSSFNNENEALAFYRDNYQTIDLIILDMIMPIYGGKKMFSLLREINPEVKVIIASGYTINGEAQDVIDAGALGFIHKPFRFLDLSQKLSANLNR